MAFAIVAGVVAGIVGFVPLMLALRLARRDFSGSVARVAVFGLGAFFISLVVLAVTLFVCSRVAHDMLLPFGLAQVAALVITTSAYVLRKNAAGTVKGSKER